MHDENKAIKHGAKYCSTFICFVWLALKLDIFIQYNFGSNAFKKSLNIYEDERENNQWYAK